MIKLALAGALVLAPTLAAHCAELPSRDGKSAPAAAARTYEFKGKRGILSADGQTCMVFGGYVSVQGGYLPH